MKPGSLVVLRSKSDLDLTMVCRVMEVSAVGELLVRSPSGEIVYLDPADSPLYTISGMLCPFCESESIDLSCKWCGGEMLR